MLEIVLLVGKFVFLLVLYVFIFRVVRSSTRELRVAGPALGKQQWRMPGGPPTADEVAAATATATAAVTGAQQSGVWTLSVVKSPCIPVGAAYALPAETHAMAGRSSDMDIFLDDTFVSSKHAMFEVTSDGLWVEDLRSTNGTQVNGTAITDSTLLEVGDQVAVGDTVFQVGVR
jgi:hypothetical protein